MKNPAGGRGGELKNPIFNCTLVKEGWSNSLYLEPESGDNLYNFSV